MNIYEAIKTLEAAQITMESLSTDNHRLTAELAEAREQKTDWHSMYQEEYDRAEAAEKRLVEISADWIVCNEKLIQAEKELAEAREIHQKALAEWDRITTRIVAENSRYREALERIAKMDDVVYSKGAFCSKIAREALNDPN